jgi:hypothetical protein
MEPSRFVTFLELGLDASEVLAASRIANGILLTGYNREWIAASRGNL